MKKSDMCTVLAVDVANRLTRLGIFTSGKLVDTWETSTPAHLTTDEARAHIAAFLGRARVRSGEDRAPEGIHTQDGLRTPGKPAAPDEPQGTVLSCVVPSHSAAWSRALEEVAQMRALVVGPGLRTGVRMQLKNSGEVGSDRVANVVAARNLLGAPAVVVSLDTTTGIEVIDQHGSYIGGAIAPGLMMSLRSLNEVAARLPLVEPQIPDSPIGRSTSEAIRAGVVLGEAARVDGLLDLIAKQLGQEAPVVLTGHHAALVSPLLRHATRMDEALTLRGLELIWRTNQ